MPEVRKDTNQASVAQEKGIGILFRLFWMAIGNIILLILLFGIFESEKKSLGLIDCFYWLIAILLLIIRYADIKYLGGLTASGSPALMSHWYRYAVVLLIIAGLLWGLAHITKYFFS